MFVLMKSTHFSIKVKPANTLWRIWSGSGFWHADHAQLLISWMTEAANSIAFVCQVKEKSNHKIQYTCSVQNIKMLSVWTMLSVWIIKKLIDDTLGFAVSQLLTWFPSSTHFFVFWWIKKKKLPVRRFTFYHANENDYLYWIMMQPKIVLHAYCIVMQLRL